MVIVMEMRSGRIVEPPAEEYGDEVLNANWLPQPDLQAGLQELPREATASCPPPEDPEAFLQAIYRNQQS